MNDQEKNALLDQLIATLDNPELRLDEFVEQLSIFSALTHQLIVKCNSTLAGGHTSIRDLKHAVIYLGLRRVRSILLQDQMAREERFSKSRAA